MHGYKNNFMIKLISIFILFFFSCKKETIQSLEIVTPPVATILSPVNNAVVKDIVPVSVNITGFTGKTQVSLVAKFTQRSNEVGILVASDSSIVFPYTMRWNSTYYSNRLVYLQIRATDSLNNIGLSNTIRVTVQ